MKFKLLVLVIASILAMSLGALIACGGDDDDDSSSNDDAATDDDAGTDDDNGGGNFQDAKDSCVEAYISCGIDEATATSACSFLDTYQSYWNDCFAAAITAYFDCLSASSCEDAGCVSTFSTDVQGCY